MSDEDGLGALLEGGVEGQPHVLAGLRALDLDDAHGLTERVLDEPSLAVLALERVVARLLEAGEAVPVGPDSADHLRGERALRIGAPWLDHGPDPLDLQLRDPVAGPGVHLALQVDEPLLPVAQLLQQVAHRQVEDRGQLGRRPGRVLDQERVGEDGHRVLGHRQLHPMPVGDRAATGGDVEVLHLLRERALLERSGLDGAEPRGPQRGCREEQKEEREQQPDSALDQAHRAIRRFPGPARGPRRPWGCPWWAEAWSWSCWAARGRRRRRGRGCLRVPVVGCGVVCVGAGGVLCAGGAVTGAPLVTGVAPPSPGSTMWAAALRASAPGWSPR